MIEKKYQRAIAEFVKRALENHKNSIENIILFGSVAREEAKEDSDIDILVVWKGDEAKGWRIMTEIAFDVLLETEEYISVKVLSSTDMNTQNPFVRNVMEEGVKIV